MWRRQETKKMLKNMLTEKNQLTPDMIAYGEELEEALYLMRSNKSGKGSHSEKAEKAIIIYGPIVLLDIGCKILEIRIKNCLTESTE